MTPLGEEEKTAIGPFFVGMGDGTIHDVAHPRLGTEWGTGTLGGYDYLSQNLGILLMVAAGALVTLWVLRIIQNLLVSTSFFVSLHNETV
jgi:hypothetical protein